MAGVLPAWLAGYIGLHFEPHGRGPNYDCYGLVRAVLAEQFGVMTLPSLSGDYRSVKDPAIAALAAAEAARAWRPVKTPRLGDVIMLNIAGRPMHVGLVIDDDWMLHIERGTDSCLARYRRPPWGNRIEGFYRFRRVPCPTR